MPQRAAARRRRKRSLRRIYIEGSALKLPLKGY